MWQLLYTRLHNFNRLTQSLPSGSRTCLTGTLAEIWLYIHWRSVVATEYSYTRQHLYSSAILTCITCIPRHKLCASLYINHDIHWAYTHATGTAQLISTVHDTCRSGMQTVQTRHDLKQPISHLSAQLLKKLIFFFSKCLTNHKATMSPDADRSSWSKAHLRLHFPSLDT